MDRTHSEPTAQDKPVATDMMASAIDDPMPMPIDPAQRVWEAAPEAPRYVDGLRLGHLMILIVAAALTVWLYVKIGSVLLLCALFALVAAAIGLATIMARQRTSRQDALLAVVAIAAERGMPLAPAVDAFADQFRGKSYRRLAELSGRLQGGTTVPAAFEDARKLVSRGAVLLSWIGQATGRLPQALRLAATSGAAHRPMWKGIASRLTYILVLLLLMQLISGFMLYFIVPKFEAIFNDFNTSLPEVTILAIETSHVIIKYFFLFLPIILLELFLLFFVPASLLGWGNLHLPFFDRLLGRRHTALVFRALSLVVDAGQPISTGLSTLASHYPTPWVRQRLIKARNDVARGVDWIESLENRGLIRPTDAEVLRSATAVGNLGWALAELAEANERRLALRFQAMIQLLFPLVVLTLGFVVFLFALAYFAPLVKLISELSRV